MSGFFPPPEKALKTSGLKAYSSFYLFDNATRVVILSSNANTMTALSHLKNFSMQMSQFFYLWKIIFIEKSMFTHF